MPMRVKVWAFDILEVSKRTIACFYDLFGEISTRLPLFSFSKKAVKGIKKHFKPCFFILKY